MKKIISALLSITLMMSCIVFASAQTDSELGIVETEAGLVQGVDTDVDTVTLFKGVPFAAPPVGENRWKAPQPVEPWEGIRVCDTWGNQAMQYDTNTEGTFWYDEFYFDEEYIPDMSEDCLYLNIYTPASSGTDNLPVLVYFHGGGNDHGNASEMEFYASKLAEKGIIVVTAQYRVNIFGFLALDELSEEDENGSSGNYALLDLVESLKWVKNNIAAFGGDPGKVTIDGQSAGAMNVRALLSSPLSDGLFNRAIIQSGFASSGFLTTGEGSVYTDLASKETRGKTAVEDAFGEGITLEELREIPAEGFIDDYATYQKLSGVGFSMNLDGYAFTEESVDLMAEGALDGIDIIIGSNADEMTSLVGGPDGVIDVEDFYTNQEKNYGESFAEKHDVNLFEKYDFKSIYDAEDDGSLAYRLNWRISSDSLLEYNRLCAEYAMAHNKDSNIYVYYFDHAPPGRNSEFYGSYHSAELWYMFNSMRDTEGQRDWTDADYRMADIMSGYWANFVKTGNPNGTDLTGWNPTSASNQTFMRFYEGQAEVSTTQFAGAAEGRTPFHREHQMLVYKLSADDLKPGETPGPSTPSEESSEEESSEPSGSEGSSEVSGEGPASSTDTDGTAKVPKTGDVTAAAAVVILLAVVVGILVYTRKKKQN